jgi:hypothetical protein
MKQIIVTCMLVLGVGLYLPFSANAQEEQLVIIGNSGSVPAELGMDQLKSVLKGEKLRWNDGSQVVIALMKTNTPVGVTTSKKLFNMTGHELNKYFLALVFQGKVKAPSFFNSPGDLKNYVAETPGAIGVIQNSNEELFNIILVDGKKQI